MSDIAGIRDKLKGEDDEGACVAAGVARAGVPCVLPCCLCRAASARAHVCMALVRVVL